ncbi:MAG: hypothetical protein NUV58_01415 [Candidatus Roizmanbacteria bacterium]|nr:hypothetical protein [Candidatus Roizmanbacteria bacterium]
MKLAQVVTSPDGEESLLILSGSEYSDNGKLYSAMKRHPQHFIPDAEYRLVPDAKGFCVSSVTGNVEEVRHG